MDLNAWLAFCAAATALAIVPGPTVTVIIANSLRYGARAGLLNVLGTQAGVAIWLAIAVTGLSAAVQVMGVWFDVLRYVGAAYLIWLGVSRLRNAGRVTDYGANPTGELFRDGFLVAVANPEHAPYGQAAVAALKNANVYEALKARLVRAWGDEGVELTTGQLAKINKVAPRYKAKQG